MRGVVPTPSEQGPLWEELGRTLEKQHIRPTGACLALYHDEGAPERDWDIEVCEPIGVSLPESGCLKVYQLPAVETMACVIHHGPFVTISQAYDAIMKWIDANGYRICGPTREIYLREAKPAGEGGPVLVSQTDAEAVTEIQFPVEKM